MPFTPPVQHAGPPTITTVEQPVGIRTYFGVIGAQALLGKPTHVFVDFDVTITDKSNRSDLYAAIAVMNKELENNVTEELYAHGDLLYRKAKFLGFRETSPMFRDASGVHGWTVQGQIRYLAIAESQA